MPEVFEHVCDPVIAAEVGRKPTSQPVAMATRRDGLAIDTRPAKERVRSNEIIKPEPAKA